LNSVAVPFRADARVISLITIGHSVSHFNQLVMPPLFLLMRDDMGLSFTELGLLMTMMYVVSAAMQTPSGFLVDRIGGRKVLIGGLLLQCTGVLLIGLAPNYWLMALAAMLSGAGNAVFHPADYAILNARVSSPRLGHAFSIHGMGGSIGWAVAPFLVLGMAGPLGWRGALLGAALLGFLVTALIIAQKDIDTHAHRRPAADSATGTATDSASDVASSTAAPGWKVLLTLAVVMSFLFLMFNAAGVIALQSFLIPASMQLFEMPQILAASALTAFFVGSGTGMVAGGFVVSRTQRHGLVCAAALVIAASLVAFLGTAMLPASTLPMMMGLCGFSLGVVSPLRDMIIRDIAPDNARGRVYGFVYTGMDIGSLFSPAMFGWVLDHGQPQWVYFGTGLLWAVGMFTLIQIRRTTLAAKA
jgi:MFS transporter, FSR family, fosmidomycin resistance protein